MWQVVAESLPSISIYGSSDLTVAYSRWPTYKSLTGGHSFWTLSIKALAFSLNI